MTLIEALKNAQQRFNLISDSARLDAECLVSFVIEKPDVFLRTWPEHELALPQQDLFEQLVQRREQGEPIAYIVGQRQFWSLEFKVNAHTLIPRPETELLVEQIIEIHQQHALHSILDLGTGSGAIAVSVSSEINSTRAPVHVIASDISEKALQVARFNAAEHQQNVEFIESNWFESIPKQKFDLIVANPPYIEENDPHLAQGDVRFEPTSALVSGSDGLMAIRTIIEQAKSWLSPKGWLLFEHGYHQADAIEQLFVENDYSRPQMKKDLSGMDRISFALNN